MSWSVAVPSWLSGPDSGDVARERLEPRLNLAAEGGHCDQDEHGDRRYDQSVLDHVLARISAAEHHPTVKQRSPHGPSLFAGYAVPPNPAQDRGRAAPRHQVR